MPFPRSNPLLNSGGPHCIHQKNANEFAVRSTIHNPFRLTHTHTHVSFADDRDFLVGFIQKFSLRTTASREDTTWWHIFFWWAFVKPLSHLFFSYTSSAGVAFFPFRPRINASSLAAVLRYLCKTWRQGTIYIVTLHP